MAKYQVQVHPRVASQLVQHAEFIARVSKPAAQRSEWAFLRFFAACRKTRINFPLVMIQTCLPIFIEKLCLEHGTK